MSSVEHGAVAVEVTGGEHRCFISGGLVWVQDCHGFIGTCGQLHGGHLCAGGAAAELLSGICESNAGRAGPAH